MLNKIQVLTQLDEVSSARKAVPDSEHAVLCHVGLVEEPSQTLSHLDLAVLTG